MDASELARATVESVAENTSDAVVAPLVWGGLLGLPGLLGYRAANTLDAMVGHRSARYARFGTAAARLDDALNLLPARLTGLLTVVAAPLGAGSTAESLRVWRRDRNDHPSPNDVLRALVGRTKPPSFAGQSRDRADHDSGWGAAGRGNHLRRR